MAQAQQGAKGDLSPRTTAIVLIVAVAVIVFLGWFFLYRQTAPPLPPPDATMPGPPGPPGPPMPPPN